MGEMHYQKKNVCFLKKFLSIDFTFPILARLALCGFLLSLIITAGLNAQIKIEERVEIEPYQNLMIPNYPVPDRTPCGPWIGYQDLTNPVQIIWNSAWYPIDPYQQLFNFQQVNNFDYILSPTKYYDVQITTGAAYCYITKQGGLYDPPEIIGNSITQAYGEDLIGTGEYVRYWLLGNYTKEILPIYLLHFERDIPNGSEVVVSITDLTNNQTINYHSFIYTPIMELRETTSDDPLPHFYSRSLEFFAARLPLTMNPDSCSQGPGGAFPSNINFSLEIIEGAEYGSIFDKQSLTYSTIFTNIYDDSGMNSLFSNRFKFVANGIQPDSLNGGYVTIRCTSSDADMGYVDATFPVTYNETPPTDAGEIYVSWDKPIVMPGDTATIDCKWLKSNNELVEFPQSLYFTYEIIEGQQFGILYNPVNGQLSNYLTNALNGIKVMTVSSIPLNVAKIKIKVTTYVDPSGFGALNKGEEGGTKEITKKQKDDGEKTIDPLIGIIFEEIYGIGELTIQKEMISVQIEPGIISAGETAEIIIKKKRTDGTLEDFPPGTLFEIGMLEGCAAGLIHAAGDSSNYFYGVEQPIYFKAAETIEGESDTVKILVGLIEQQQSGMQMVGGGEKEMQPEVKSNYLKSPPGGVPSNPLGFACFIGEFESEINAPAELVVQDECDFENCGSWNYEDIKILMNRQSNNFEFREGQFITVCDLNNPNTTTDDVGQSKPVPYERKRKELNWGNGWEVEPCINNNGRVQFSIVTPDRLTIADLYFDFVEAVCTDIITNPPNNGIIITDLSLSGVTSGKDAMNDFCGHQLYPIRTGTPSRGGYYIEEVIRVHEGIHGDRFYKVLNENKSMLINELNKLVLDCQEYEKFWKIDGVEQYIINALNTYYQFCETEYFAKNNEQEIQCHFAIIELIDKYMKQVNFRFKTKIPDIPCYRCKQ